jgi:anti-sigma regulatory factor (Ser/Thr protein kinase)
MHSTDLARAQSRPFNPHTAAGDAAERWPTARWWPDGTRDLGPDVLRPGTSATLTLPALPESVQTARRFASGTLGGWGLAGLAEDMGVVVSELATNAIRHGLTLHRGPGHRPAEPLRMSLSRRGDLVTYAVADTGERPPVRRVPGSAEPGGLGVHIVESISLRWGWTPLAPHGKAVWAILQG